MHRVLRAAFRAALLTTAIVAPSQAVPVSGASPFGPGCNGAPPSGGTEYHSSEVEPFAAIKPTATTLNGTPIVGVWQQDRWSDGGANGLAAATSSDGGATWATQG